MQFWVFVPFLVYIGVILAKIYIKLCAIRDEIACADTEKKLKELRKHEEELREKTKKELREKYGDKPEIDKMIDDAFDKRGRKI